MSLPPEKYVPKEMCDICNHPLRAHKHLTKIISDMFALVPCCRVIIDGFMCGCDLSRPIEEKDGISIHQS